MGKEIDLGKLATTLSAILSEKYGADVKVTIKEENVWSTDMNPSSAE